jgi:hypothetical protein
MRARFALGRWATFLPCFNDFRSLARLPRIFLLALSATLSAPQIVSAALITPLSGPNDFVSAVTYTDDFESGVVNSPPLNTPPFTYDGASQLGLASLWTAGVTPSGLQGLVKSANLSPLKFVFASPVGEVGMFFGNDDLGRIFDARLEIFDAADNLLGFVLVRCNGNDKADQYIGVRSSAPVKWAQISYDQPNAQTLSVYVDDLRVGMVPEPANVTLVLCGCFALAAVARRSRNCYSVS